MAANKNGRGRNGKVYDENVRSAVIVAISTGALIKDACEMAGIGLATYYQWMSIGEACAAGLPHPRRPHRLAERQIYAEFAEAVKKGRAASQFRAVKTIQSAGLDRWVHGRTGMVRNTAPPPKTWVHNLSGQVFFEMTDAIAYDRDTDHWEEEWSGQSWDFVRGDWKAHAWFLERSNPSEWARRTSADITINDWREEAQQAGISPAAVADEFEQLVQVLAEKMEADNEQ